MAEPQIIVGGSASRGEVLIGMDSGGQEHWKVALSATKGRIDSAQAAPGTPWIAVGMRGGTTHVVDVEKGAIVASQTGQGRATQVGWRRGDDETSPLLIVATGQQLNAFRVIEANEGEEAAAED